MELDLFNYDMCVTWFIINKPKTIPFLTTKVMTFTNMNYSYYDQKHIVIKAYLKMVCTATIVLQSASVSSSNELELSLLTTTTLSARLIPARSRSSRLKIENIFVTVHCCYNIVDFLQTAHARNSASCHQQSPETKLRYHFFLVSAAVNSYM